jgi:hypothetical protein
MTAAAAANLNSASLDSLPSVEIVRKWKRKYVLNFLQEYIEGLDIEPGDIKVIEDNRVAGIAFLGSTRQMLINHPYNLPGGPAGAIAYLVERINGRGQCKVLESK